MKSHPKTKIIVEFMLIYLVKNILPFLPIFVSQDFKHRKSCLNIYLGIIERHRDGGVRGKLERVNGIRGTRSRIESGIRQGYVGPAENRPAGRRPRSGLGRRSRRCFTERIIHCYSFFFYFFVNCVGNRYWSRNCLNDRLTCFGRAPRDEMEQWNHDLLRNGQWWWVNCCAFFFFCSLVGFLCVPNSVDKISLGKYVGTTRRSFGARCRCNWN